MRAITYTRPGDPSVLELVERPTPKPGHGELRIRVLVSGVNPTDWKSRSGLTGVPTAANTFCGKVDVWSTATGARIGHELSFVGAEALGPERLSHDGSLLAVANSGKLGQVTIVRVATGRTVAVPPRPSHPRSPRRHAGRAA